MELRQIEVKAPTTAIRDNGKVRMGSLSPAFPAVRTPSIKTEDSGKVRMGSLSPAFPAVRAPSTRTGAERAPVLSEGVLRAVCSILGRAIDEVRAALARSVPFVI